MLTCVGEDQGENGFDELKMKCFYECALTTGILKTGTSIAWSTLAIDAVYTVCIYLSIQD
jgi:hypothetical protein